MYALIEGYMKFKSRDVINLEKTTVSAVKVENIDVEKNINIITPVKSKVKYREKKKYECIKRIFDVVASLFALIVLSPFFLIAMIMVFVTDFGNPFFVQERVGKNGKIFKMYKFRSMYKNAEEKREDLLEQNEVDGPIFKIEDDPRITSVGKILRKTSIDELPQLVNILKGEMSIVGPRPFIPIEQSELPDDRLLVKPGLSCYWQIGGKHKLTMEEQIALDYKYIEERSCLVDLKIIFKTFAVIFKSDNC